MNNELFNWENMTFSMMSAAEKTIATSNIVREDENINSLFYNCAERAINTLILLNSGGCITVLAYIYRTTKSSSNYFLNFSLIIFILGLLFVFYVIESDFRNTRNKSLDYKKDIKNFLLDKITFREIKKFQLSKVSDTSFDCTTLVGYLSAACALFGIATGIIGYFIQ